jgi:hypothetical protein
MMNASSKLERPLSVLVRMLGMSLFALLLLLAVRPPASAQEACMDHSELSSMLGQRFAEKSVARGLDANGRMVEIYATDDGATWSMVITTPEGQSCVVASGEAWAERVQSELGQAV